MGFLLSEGARSGRISLEFRLRFGLDYGVIMRHEHVNKAREVTDVLSHFYSDVRSEYLGAGLHLSLYQFHACRQPSRELCGRYLEHER